MSGKFKAIPIKTIGCFKIYKTRNPNYERQYIIWNTHFAFKNGHTHRFTLWECESIIQNLLNDRNPVRKGSWKDYNDILESHIRLAEDETYINHLINLSNEPKRMKKATFKI